MFYYLNGVVAHVEPFLAVIDCNGVGRMISAPTPLKSARIVFFRVKSGCFSS